MKKLTPFYNPKQDEIKYIFYDEDKHIFYDEEENQIENIYNWLTPNDLFLFFTKNNYTLFRNKKNNNLIIEIIEKDGI